MLDNNFQNTTSFIGFVQNGRIFNSYGQPLGYTTDEYNKAIDTAKGFEKILYEKGILTKPKTPEEINKELQETLKQTQSMMLEMSGTIGLLNEKVSKLENSNVKQAVTDDNSEQDPVPGKSASTKSGFRGNK
ncbi:MAG: hypothetical protein IJW72_00390 [Alphaproteobacteria bacterium]|nr:hypothetical protein [Alphaproteobacteria bacterium]MBQ7284700.1 hypothetical protein [Alphaproteobacteria bacterium]